MSWKYSPWSDCGRMSPASVQSRKRLPSLMTTGWMKRGRSDERPWCRMRSAPLALFSIAIRPWRSATLERHQGQASQAGGRRRDPAAVRGQPDLAAEGAGAAVEVAVRAVGAGHRLPEIVRPVRVRQPVVLLGVVAGAPEVAVEPARDKLLAPYRFDRGPADQHFAPVMVRRPVHRLCAHLGLEDRR